MLQERKDRFICNITVGDRAGVKKKMLVSGSTEYNGLSVPDGKTVISRSFLFFIS
jgi:hypothetical protein